MSTPLDQLVQQFNEQQGSVSPSSQPAILLENNGNTLRLSYQCIRSCVFDKVLNKIGGLLEKMLSKAVNSSGTREQTVQYVFLVGNFAKSGFLYDDLAAICEQHQVQLVVPADCGNAIVIGACIVRPHSRHRQDANGCL